MRYGIRTRPAATTGDLTTGFNIVFADPDINNFLAATGITDPTIAAAIADLVTDLKINNFWSKFKAIYPMVGGTSTTCKFNLIDPQDTDGAFRLTFNGGWTITSTGVAGNGTTGYANTYLAPNAHLSLNDTHISFYSRTNSIPGAGTGDVEMGTVDGANGRLFIVPSYSSTLGAFRAVNSAQTSAGTRQTSTGLFMANRIASGTMKLFRNGSAVLTDSVSSNTLSQYSIYIGSFNVANTSTDASPRECAFASIGTGFSDADASTFYTIVQNFNTALGRQV